MDNSNVPFYINGAEFYSGPVVLAYCMDNYNVVQEPVTSFEMLKSRLEEIKQEAKEHIPIYFTVDIVVKDKGCLSVGLGENESIVVWYAATDDLYLTSLGDELATGTKLYYFGDWTELSDKHTISWETALLLMKTWIESGDIGNCINWTAYSSPTPGV